MLLSLCPSWDVERVQDAYGCVIPPGMVALHSTLASVSLDRSNVTPFGQSPVHDTDVRARCLQRMTKIRFRQTYVFDILPCPAELVNLDADILDVVHGYPLCRWTEISDLIASGTAALATAVLTYEV